MPFEGCQGEACHCQAVRILALIVGRQRVCPVCRRELKADEEQTILEEMLKLGDSPDAEPGLLAVHIECQPKLVEVRDKVAIINLLGP